MFRHLVTSMLLFWAPGIVSAQVRTPPPVIERIEPTSGAFGTTVQMIGRHFRPEQIVQLSGTPVEVLTRMPNRWSFRIPEGARSGPLSIELTDVPAVRGPEFRIVPAGAAPVISEVSPRSAAPGAEVRLIGEHFSPRASDDLVRFDGAPVVVRSATPNELTVIVPMGASGGRFEVEVRGAGRATAPYDLEITEGVSIAQVSPELAAPGARFTITGAGFATRSIGNRVFIGSTPCRVLTATATSISAEVPRGASTDLVLVDVRGVGRAYSSTPLVVRAAPSVSAVEPPAGPPGTRIRLRGNDFGSDVRTVEVLFGTTRGTIRAIQPSEIMVDVPEGATSGPLTVRVAGLPEIRALPEFQVLAPPVVSDFQPRSGAPGTEVVVRGSGFSPGRTSVRIGAQPCEVVSASADELRVRIPAAASGPLTVEVEHAGGARTVQAFVVTSPPFIARFTPRSGTPGTEIEIFGNGFGDNAQLVEASLGDRRMEIRSVAADRMVAVVPANAVRGRLRISVRLQGSATSSQDFEVVGPFSIRTLEPSAIAPGQEFTLRGVGFSSRGMELRVEGAATPIPFAFINTTELRAVLPGEVTRGRIDLRSADERTASATFDLLPTPDGVGIYALTPQCSRPGCNVVVRGWGFSPNRTGNRITIGSTQVRPRRATPHELEFALPELEGTTTIRIEVRGKGTAETAPLTISR